MKRFVLLVSLLLLISACVSWEPRIGMTYQEFRNTWATSDNWDQIRFVGANGAWRSYETDGTFYYFENHVLRRADQGQFFEQTYNFEFD